MMVQARLHAQARMNGIELCYGEDEQSLYKYASKKSRRRSGLTHESSSVSGKHAHRLNGRGSLCLIDLILFRRGFSFSPGQLSNEDDKIKIPASYDMCLKGFQY